MTRTAIVHDLAGPATFRDSPRRLRAAVWMYQEQAYVVRYLPEQWESALLAIDGWPLPENERYRAARPVLHNAMLDGYRDERERVERSLVERFFEWLFGEVE